MGRTTYQRNNQPRSHIGEVKAGGIFLQISRRLTEPLQKDGHLQKPRDLARVIAEDEPPHRHAQRHDDGADGDVREAVAGVGGALLGGGMAAIPVAGDGVHGGAHVGLGGGLGGDGCRSGAGASAGAGARGGVLLEIEYHDGGGRCGVSQ
jgi:hypothetical protein